MPIAVTCSQCLRDGQVPDNLSGCAPGRHGVAAAPGAHQGVHLALSLDSIRHSQ